MRATLGASITPRDTGDRQPFRRRWRIAALGRRTVLPPGASLHVGTVTPPAASTRAVNAQREGDIGTGTMPRTRRQELFVFAILAVVVWPILTIGVVGAYGFAVWMYQSVAGPPGPPSQPGASVH